MDRAKNFIHERKVNGTLGLLETEELAFDVSQMFL
jgi:hypothetical protein